MAKKVSVRTDSLKYDLEIPDHLTELYADGVANTTLGLPLCRLTLFRLDPPVFGEPTPAEEGVEPRKAVAHLTIPSTSLLEFARKTIAAFEENKLAVKEGAKIYETAFSRLLPD